MRQGDTRPSHASGCEAAASGERHRSTRLAVPPEDGLSVASTQAGQPSFAFYFAEVPTESLRRGHVVIEARDERGKLLDEEVAQAPDVITR